MEVIYFRGDLFLRLYMPHEYRENKSLAKLNSVTVSGLGTDLGY